jgi:hypothetical protein
MMRVLDHTPYTKKQIVEPIVTSHATNIMPRENGKSIRPPNGPTLNEHVVQGLHILTPSVHTHNKELPFRQNRFTLWVI